MSLSAAVPSNRRNTDALAGQSPVDYEQLFLSQLEVIDGAVAFIARRHRLTADEAEEFAAVVHLRLIEDNYGVLRKFQRRSSLRTYLIVVINRLFLDQRASMWGKWRASALAKREGAIAVLLEQLTVAQGLSFDQACSVLEASDTLKIDRTALKRLYDRLPQRSRRYFVGEEALANVAATDSRPDHGLDLHERGEAAQRAWLELADELAGLAPEDRQILRLRFVEGVTIRQIAHRIAATDGSDAKRLYPRVCRLLENLRGRLERRGVAAPDALDALASLASTSPQSSDAVSAAVRGALENESGAGPTGTEVSCRHITSSDFDDSFAHHVNGRG